MDLDRPALIDVFSQLPSDVSALALAGASQPCLADILHRLPAELSCQLQAQLERLGPLRLRDIHIAQQAAVNLGLRANAAASATQPTTHLKLMA